MKLIQTYKLKAYISLTPSANGGRQKPIFSGYRPALKFHTKALFSCQITLPNHIETLSPGQAAFVDIDMIPAKAIPKNLGVSDAFTIFDGTRPIGSGHIVEVKHTEKAANMEEAIA
jgi:elongation factor Tu